MKNRCVRFWGIPFRGLVCLFLFLNLFLPTNSQAQVNPFGSAQAFSVTQSYTQFSGIGVAADVTRDGIFDAMTLSQASSSFTLKTSILGPQGTRDAIHTSGPFTLASGHQEGRDLIAGQFRTATPFQDLIALTRGLKLILYRNPGQLASATASSHEGIGLNSDPQNTFFPPFQIGNLASTTPYGPGENHIAPGIFLSDDINGDGHMDFVVAATNFIHPPSTSYLEATNSGVYAYLGNGIGGFPNPIIFPGHDLTTRIAIPGGLSGAIIDFKWVNLLPGNPTPQKTLVVLTEEHSSYGGIVEVLSFLQWNTTSNSFTHVTPPIDCSAVTAGRISGFEIHDINGDGNLDYAFTANERDTQLIFSGWIQGYLGDPQGYPTGLSSPPTYTLTLPPTPYMGHHHEIHGMKMRDFDGDDISDLVYVRAYGYLAPADVVFIAGPLTQTANPTHTQIVSLGGWMPNENSTNTYLPFNYSKARNIQFFDNDGNGLNDIMVFGLRLGNSNAVAVVPNLATPGLPTGEARNYTVPRVTQSGYTPRIGTQGGRPTLGNLDFKVIQRGWVPGLSGLASSDFKLEFQHMGLDLGIVPGTGPSSNLFTVNSGIAGNIYHEQSIPIPNHASLLGLKWYFQWLNFDPSSTDPFPIYPSDALELTVGR